MSSITSPTSIAMLRDLPSLPQVILDLQFALAREDVSVDDIADSVALDQGLAARTLRIANCSFYGVSRRVVSIRQAIGILGLRSVSTLLTAAAVSSCFPRVVCREFDLRSYWRHSVAVALCARGIARELHLDPDVAFTAGLMHDLGRLALASQVPQALEKTLVLREKIDCTMLNAERSALCTDHTELGQEIAMRWHFGSVVVEAIHRHHEPPPAETANIVDIVHVADNIAHALDLADDPQEMVPALDASAWTRVGLTAGQSLMIFTDTESELDGLCEALGV